jgi:hypothetical protein
MIRRFKSAPEQTGKGYRTLINEVRDANALAAALRALLKCGWAQFESYARGTVRV